jgi:hypothetical protein
MRRWLGTISILPYTRHTGRTTLRLKRGGGRIVPWSHTGYRRRVGLLDYVSPDPVHGGVRNGGYRAATAAVTQLRLSPPSKTPNLPVFGVGYAETCFRNRPKCVDNISLSNSQCTDALPMIPTYCLPPSTIWPSGFRSGPRPLATAEASDSPENETNTKPCPRVAL